MMIKKRILIAAQNAGGFNSLAPVIKALKKRKKYEVKLILAGASKKSVKQYGWNYVDGEKFNINKLRKLVAQFKPQCIATGTSGGMSVEKKIIKIAHEYNIPSAAVLDFWINYNIRFSFDNSKKLHPEALPDHILIMDNHAKREMINEGFPSEILAITGNPHFDTMKPIKQENKKTKTILFIDQPISESIKAGWHENYGYTELTAFSDIVHALRKIGFKDELIAALHPRTEGKEKYEAIIKKYPEFKLQFSQGVRRNEKALRKAHLVVGMTSIMLLEAALRGRLALSYQPKLKKTDPLKSNALGLTAYVYKKEKLAAKIKKLLLQKKPESKNQRIIDKYTKANATKNVVQFIEKMVRVYAIIGLLTRLEL